MGSPDEVVRTRANGVSMKEAIILALTIGLIAGSLGMPEEAKKKKKKKKPAVVLEQGETKYFLRWDGDGSTCDANYLSITDAEDGGSGCEATVQPAQEVLTAAGQQITRDWAAVDGL